MPPSSHAVLSASGAARWLHCPPSAVLEAELPERDSSASLQGTAAHALAEYKLRCALGQSVTKPQNQWIDAPMEEFTDSYVDFVLGELKTAGDGAKCLVEQRLDMRDWVPGGFGTGDCLIISDDVLHVIDFKYGQGVLVESSGNPQLKLYALGAWAVFGALYDFHRVRTTIHQPRRENIATEEYEVDELIEWAETVVRPTAALAANGAGKFQAGSWCQFCKLAATCRARAQANLVLAKLEFKPAAELSDSEISDILARLPGLRSWASEVEKYATSAAVNQGKHWPGLKLVAGRSVRRFLNEDEVAKTAAAAGFDDIWETKLIGITAMEKLMGKKTFNELLSNLVVKPDGKPTLVPESDKRPEISVLSAADEFKEIK